MCAAYLPAMRHRVILNFEAQAEGIASDRVLLDLLEQVPEKAGRIRGEPRMTDGSRPPRRC